MNTQRIEISDRQQTFPVDAGRIRRAIRSVLDGEGIQVAEINVAIVDNAEIHALNREYLGHDNATDVISFSIGEPDGHLEGELMISAEKAQETAPRFDWSSQAELELYAIHGTLHLTGYDDLEEAAATEMRRKEAHYLALLGIDVSRQDCGAVRPGGTPH